MRGSSLFHPVARALLVATLTCCVAGCAMLGGSEVVVEEPDGSRIRAVSARLGTSWGLAAFHSPEEGDAPRLIELEPYRPGKIPVVFIHGLASAPGTWKAMLERLEEDESIRERYQFWVFQYPTGVSFLGPAAELRRQLASTIEAHDPDGDDPALKHVVLVGHSMGGLVARLQVTDSQDDLWGAFFTRPAEELNTDEATRNDLRQLMMFEPVPYVDRVIFIATPHRGSRWTERPIGYLGRSLVWFPQAVSSRYGNLLRSNADKLSDQLTVDVPTSVDHLKPGNAVLAVLEQLHPEQRVHLHSIVGTGRLQPDFSFGDGVVSTGSARLEDAESEVQVPAAHTSVHKHPDAIEEVRRLLQLHAETVPGSVSLGTLHTPEPLRKRIPSLE